MSSKHTKIFLVLTSLLSLLPSSLPSSQARRTEISQKPSDPTYPRLQSWVFQNKALPPANSPKFLEENAPTEGRPNLRYPGEILLQVPHGASAISLLQSEAWVYSVEHITADTLLIRFEEAQIAFADAVNRLQSILSGATIEANYALLYAADSAATSQHQTNTPPPYSPPSAEPPKPHLACIIDSALNPELSHQGQRQDFSLNDPLQAAEPSSLHGSLVYGLVAGLAKSSAKASNDLPTICVASIFEDDGYARLSSLLKALLWSAERSSLINLSLGLYQDSQVLRRLIEQLKAKGITLVAAAGNDASGTLLYPAAYPEVIAVASHDKNFERSSFSNWTAENLIFTLGEGLESYPSQGYIQTLTGTSAATASVTRMLLEGLLEGLNLKEAIDSLRAATLIQNQRAPLVPPSFARIDMLRLEELRRGVPLSQISITRFQSPREFIVDDTVALEIAWQAEHPNTSAPFALSMRDQLGSSYDIPLPRSTTADQINLTIDLTDYPLLAKDRAISFALRSLGKALQGPQLIQISPRPLEIQTVKLKEFWVEPLDFWTQGVEHSLTAIVHNRSQTSIDRLTLKLFTIPAVHEGLARTPRQLIGSFPLTDSISPESFESFRIKIPPVKNLPAQLSFLLELYQDDQFLDSQFKSYHQTQPYQAMPLYSQEVHRYMVEEAVRLLENQGIFIRDLRDPNLVARYRGAVAEQNNWPKIGTKDFHLPTQTLEVSNFWSDAVLERIKAYFAINNFSLLDGANDADSIDIVYGYSFEDVFDSHFWIVDKHDNDGLDSNGTNHNSALTKIRALLFGGGQLQYGAIEHYRQGHTWAAWWFLGHAAHLLGDLTVPSHVNDENAHGTYGDAYHDWMDKGAYRRWSAAHPLISAKGFIDPYSERNLGDPVRYLAYTSAQLGNSFAWASTLPGTTFGKEGNRIAGGDFPHYEQDMDQLFAALPARPLREWHINKDEVKDVFGDCQLVDWMGPTEKRADCKDKDGHKDRDNTDSKGNDEDGDLSRIADSNFTYGIRAIAGLIYFFAKETGQL